VNEGDLVVLCEILYTRYKGKTGLLVGQNDRSKTGLLPAWIVMIDGRTHPYIISESDMRKVT